MVYAIARSLQRSLKPIRLQNGFLNVIHPLERVGLGTAMLTANRNISSVNAGGLPTHYTLPSGDKIPSVALTVGFVKEIDNVAKGVETALQTGYRHIDGAWIYRNEAEIAKGIKASGVPREDIFLTSKLWNTAHEPNDVEPALDESLARLETDYLDSYVIQWPIAFKKEGKGVDLEVTENIYATWQKLEEMVEKKKVRNIGLSNFSIKRIENLLANPLKIKPAINHVEMNYWFPQPELLKWSKENGILVASYCPLGSTERFGGLKKTLNVREVKQIAGELSITPSQLYHSWLVQRGTVLLCKISPLKNIVDNLQITKLPDDAFLRLETLATSHEPNRGRDPSKYWDVDVWN